MASISIITAMTMLATGFRLPVANSVSNPSRVAGAIVGIDGHACFSDSFHQGWCLTSPSAESGKLGDEHFANGFSAAEFKELIQFRSFDIASLGGTAGFVNNMSNLVALLLGMVVRSAT